MKAYKALTHDYCSPIQGGAPIFDGRLPFTLPTVKVDQSEKDCAGGWNACRDSSTALRTAGLWPDGWPSKVFEVKTDHPVVERRDKLRAASWDLMRQISEDEVREAISELSKPFGEFQEEMVEQQMLWHEALGRPRHDRDTVERCLREALDARGLNWNLREYGDARDAWEVRGTREGKAAWAAWVAWGAWATRDARTAWVAWDARATRDVRATRDARDALVVYYCAKKEWTKNSPMLLTTGTRDAYRNGLSFAFPVGKDMLGWSMSQN